MTTRKTPALPRSAPLAGEPGPGHPLPRHTAQVVQLGRWSHEVTYFRNGMWWQYEERLGTHRSVLRRVRRRLAGLARVDVIRATPTEVAP